MAVPKGQPVVEITALAAIPEGAVANPVRAGDPWASEIEQPAIPHERPPVKYEPWTACLHLRPPGLPLTSSQPPSGISAAVGANDGTEESDEETDSEECRVEARNRYSQYVRGIGPTDDKWPVDWKRVEVLNKKVPQWANFTVNSQSLTREYEGQRWRQG